MATDEEMQRRSQECADLGDRLLDGVRQQMGEALERYAVALVVYERVPWGAASLSARHDTRRDIAKLCEVLDGLLQLYAGTLDAPHSKIDVREVEP